MFLFRSVLSVFFFFFSSRRRHTRCLSDWSSDVCSSDLKGRQPLATPRGIGARVGAADLGDRTVVVVGRDAIEVWWGRVARRREEAAVLADGDLAYVEPERRHFDRAAREPARRRIRLELQRAAGDPDHAFLGVRERPELELERAAIELIDDDLERAFVAAFRPHDDPVRALAQPDPGQRRRSERVLGAWQ